MSRLLVILDGAAEPVGVGPTALEAAHTPALDALVAAGELGRLATTPAGLAAGSETGIPTLLGCPPAAPVGRGLIEAAAAHVAVPAGAGAWRIDAYREDGTRASAEEARGLAATLGVDRCRVRVTHLRGHRLLAVGLHAPQLEALDGFRLHVWGEGEPLAAQLDERTAVVCAVGAAAGCARLLGARVVVPQGVTGDVDSDLSAKARAAAALLREGVETVVVHVGGPDEAAHRRDPAAKRAAIEAADRELVAPLAPLAAHVAVAIDHETCPRTGRHGAAPTPVVTVSADARPLLGRPSALSDPNRADAADTGPLGPSADERPPFGRASAVTDPRGGPARRFTERDAASTPVRNSLWLPARVAA